MAYSKEILSEAHKRSIFHKTEITVSGICGCFHCERTFKPQEILEWVDENDPRGETALCPICGIDAVLGSASNYPIDDKEFLTEMRRYWF